MDRNFEAGKHEEVSRKCANPNCNTIYIVQNGGQKAGSSPAVHIEKVGETPKGYCSTRCLFKANGWDSNELKKLYLKYGIDYDKVFPEGYLAPARRRSLKIEQTHAHDQIYNPGNIILPHGEVLIDKPHYLLIPAYGKHNGGLIDTKKFPEDRRIAISGQSNEDEKQTLLETTFDSSRTVNY